jgi:hypothetical protein
MASKPVRFIVAGKRPPKVEEEPGERGLARHARATVPRHRRVGDGSDGEDHDVGGIVGVGPGGDVVEEEARGEAVAAEQAARHGLGHRLDAAPPARHVDVEDAAAVTFHDLVLTRPSF